MMRIILGTVMLLLAQVALADTMRMAVTTSFDNSGLSDVLLPAIRDDLGLEVQLLVVGTGQALRLGAAGDVDAVLVHARAAEDAFIAAGHAPYRREIMYNDFVLIGPASDAAGIAQAGSATDAVQRIAHTRAPFVSRGDDSGTHAAEERIWQAAALEADTFGPWYRAVGAGMGAALNTASAMDAYVLSDRASWLNFANKGGLALLFEGDAMLFNQYAFLPVNPDKNAAIRHDLALKLETWLTSPRAAALINGYTIADQQLFVFNAAPN